MPLGRSLHVALICSVSYTKKPVHMHTCYQIHLPDVVLTYVTQRTEAKKLPGWDYYTKLQLHYFKLQFFWSITDFNTEWVFKDMYVCSIPTKVTESCFKIRNHFYSRDTMKGNTYWPILMKQITGWKMTQVNISNCFPNSFSFISKALTAISISEMSFCWPSRVI
jgi:hypothetical protein